MNKEELNQEIGKLKASLEAHESQVKDLQQDLKVAEKKLADSNKPKLTIEQLNAIENAIETAINSYNGLNEENCYDYEMSMEYDNKIYLSHIEFNDGDDLARVIYAKVEDLFGVADESDDTQDVTNE
jgi:chromosome segregation ATPase|tara:strand:+ start:533 stop:913 length:381 start_codon:yes stop_codon:yes gene_type:complete